MARDSKQTVDGGDRRDGGESVMRDKCDTVF